MAQEEFKGPSMSGTFHGFQPQWKHRGVIGESINKRVLVVANDEGKTWTDVPYTLIRGAPTLRLPDGSTMPIGVPFPRRLPGVLETIMLCGYEQAMALAWTFAAWAAAQGAEVEVRAEEYKLNYSIKAERYEGKSADGSLPQPQLKEEKKSQ